jgi:glycosyltransferase involved in cell wall biosynthesis
LTKDEEENIARTLESLRWAPHVVVVDSGSRDRTREIASGFPNVSWCEHEWAGFGEQWRFGLNHTGISSGWVLALDADMRTTPPLVAELLRIAENPETDGAYLAFDYMIDGTLLAGSFYPPQLRFLRAANASVWERGHTQEFRVKGRVVRARNRLIHDDRKPFERFVAAQVGYSSRELAMLEESDRPFAFRDWLRRHFPLLPEIVGLSGYLRAGGPLRGRAARRYALERLMFEAMLRYRLLASKRP